MSHELSAAASGVAPALPARAARRSTAVGPRRTVPSRRAVVAPEGPDFTVRIVRARRRLVLGGEFDRAAVEPFAAAAAVLAGGSGDLTVDLARVQFIDAAGLGALVALRNTLNDAGQRLRLRRPTPRTIRVFAAGRLLELLSAADPATGPAEPPV